LFISVLIIYKNGQCCRVVDEYKLDQAVSTMHEYGCSYFNDEFFYHTLEAYK